MSDYWERMPNPEGRSEGPIYRRTFEVPGGIVQFEIKTAWRRPERGFADRVKDGYVVSGLPKKLTPGHTGAIRVDTLGEGKKRIELIVAEVNDGRRDSKTWDLVRVGP